MDFLDFYRVCFFLGVVTSFGIAVLMLFESRGKSANRNFFLVTIFGAIWSFGFYRLVGAESINQAFFWRWFMESGSILLPIWWLKFIYDFLEVSPNRKILSLVYISGIIIWALNLLDFFKPGIFAISMGQKLVFNYYPTAGLGYYLFYLYFASIIFYTSWLLYAAFKKNSRDRAAKIGYVLFAAQAGLVGGGMTFLPTLDVLIHPVGIALFPFYPIIIAYAILKHRLFDVRVVATEALLFLLWLFLLVRTIFAETTRDRFIEGGLLSATVILGIFLIRSVLQEVRQREEIQVLAEDLRKANLELKKLDQLKSEFVSLASHQLRTPLTVIKGYISMIQEGSFGAISDQLKDALRKIMVSNQTLINLVGDFLNLSRIESGRMKYLFEPMNAEDMMQSVFEEFKEVVKEKKLELTFEKPESPLPQAMLDKDKFRQVIMNLVDNAIKYTPKGWIKMKIEEDRDRPGGPFVLMSISDSGIGMTEDVMNSIFKRFSRGEEGWKANTGGLGLGLYLAKRIVTDHGGEIWATSEGANKGSAFWVRLPARAAQIEKDKQLKDFVAKI